MSMVIDSHQHFWKYNKHDFGWIGASMQSIKQDFLPEDLDVIIKEAGIQGVISVQARQSIEETRWLQQLAKKHAYIKGIVGWLPITDPALDDLIGEFMPSGKMKGLRHVIQDEFDPNYILGDDFNRGIGILERHGLVYDILIFEKHLLQTISFVDRHPNQVFVLDHIAKPKIRDRVISPWKEHIYALAQRENVFCKISGLVTEADFFYWTEDQFIPYLDIVLDAFGPGRLMFGSDWPVCTVATSYQHWFHLLQKVFNRLSETEKKAIFGNTATTVYKL